MRSDRCRRLEHLHTQLVLYALAVALKKGYRICPLTVHFHDEHKPEGYPVRVEIVDGNWRYLAATDTPKLLLYAQPGAVIGADAVARCKETLPDLTVTDVGEGLHFLPEDQPHEIGEALARWLDERT